MAVVSVAVVSVAVVTSSTSATPSSSDQLAALDVLAANLLLVGMVLTGTGLTDTTPTGTELTGSGMELAGNIAAVAPAEILAPAEIILMNVGMPTIIAGKIAVIAPAMGAINWPAVKMPPVGGGAITHRPTPSKFSKQQREPEHNFGDGMFRLHGNFALVNAEHFNASEADPVIFPHWFLEAEQLCSEPEGFFRRHFGAIPAVIFDDQFPTLERASSDAPKRHTQFRRHKVRVSGDGER